MEAKIFEMPNRAKACSIVAVNIAASAQFGTSHYLPIPLKGKALESCQRYKLGVYRESEYTYSPTGSEGTIPVLFIPGSQGHARQVRSLATVAFETQLMYSLNYTFEFFALDFFQDTSALSSEVVERQADCVVDVIPFVYSLFAKAPTPVTIVGHSMGGVIGHYALAQAKFDPLIVNSVITLASPLRSPVVSLSIRLLRMYDRIHEFWRTVPLDSNYDHLTFLSITGGISDHQVWDGLGKTALPVDRALHLSSPSVNQVWLSCDHLSILWCRQLVFRINDALFASVNTTTRMPLTSRAKRMDVLQKIFLSHPVPLKPPLPGKFGQSPAVINPRCAWFNRAGDPNGVYTAAKGTCTYFKIGPLTGEAAERVLLLPTNLNVKTIYLCDKSVNSVPCPTLYELPEESVQWIMVPGNAKNTGKARSLFVVGFNKDNLTQCPIDVAGASLVVHLTHQTKGSLMFDLINNVDARQLEWTGVGSRSAIYLPRNHSRATFFRMPLPFDNFHFGPALPPPSIQVDAGSCPPESNLVGLLISSLPWDHQVYHHRFDPRISAAFDLQTVSPLPEHYENLTTPFVDVIIDPRCDNTRIYFSYSYSYWIFQIVRVHLFHTPSLITGHALLSIFLLLASHTVHFQAPSCKRSSNFAFSSPLLSADATVRGRLTNEWKTTKHFLVAVGLHCFAALLLCLFHSLRLTIDDSSLWTLLVPTSSWIELERRGDLGRTWAGPSHSPLVSLMPFYLLNLLYAILVPLILHCLADSRTPLALTFRVLSRLTGLPRLNQYRPCCEARAHPFSFYIALACIFTSFFFHDGVAFLVIAFALLLKCGFMLTKATANDEMALKITPMDEQSQVLMAVQLRFALLFVFCSFLCIEQWFTFAFKAKIFFAGYGFDWLRFFQPTVFRFFLLLTTALLLCSPPTPLISVKGHRFRRLPLLLLALALLTTLTGCLACLGGYLHTAASLQACLLVTMATMFLLGLWVAMATTPFAVAAAVSFGQGHGRLVIALFPSRAV
ncbi:GPI inositol-deacylase [Echinococcus granulosus]|nr:GPI inositol-deacylase [Echinococcus granulosus]